jgi:succinate dehydrogenase/fumarate reductase cytochrome b subunit
MTLRNLHIASAVLITAYAIVHLVNHVVGLAGVDAYIALMNALRAIYRHPFVEGLLLVAVAVQVCSGLSFVVRGWKQRRGFVAWLQARAPTSRFSF